MNFKKGQKNVQTAGYNGAGTVIIIPATFIIDHCAQLRADNKIQLLMIKRYMTKRCSFSVYITGKCQICCYHTGVRFVLVLSCSKITYTNSNPVNRKSFTFPCVLISLLLLNVSFFCLLGLNLVRRNCTLLSNVQIN